MPRSEYNPNRDEWDKFFASQVGHGAYFQAANPYQRGLGFGSVFSSLLKFLLPVAKSVGKEVGRESLATGGRMISRILGGEEGKEVLKSEAKQGIKNLSNRANARIQSGWGRRRKASRKKKKIPIKRRIVRTKPRRKRSSTKSLGLW